MLKKVRWIELPLTLSMVLSFDIKTYQYADDTTIYQHCKPIEIKSCEMQLQQAMDKLSS